MDRDSQNVMMAAIVLWLLWKWKGESSVTFPQNDVLKQCPDGSVIPVMNTCRTPDPIISNRPTDPTVYNGNENIPYTIYYPRDTPIDVMADLNYAYLNMNGGGWHLDPGRPHVLED